jgi:hypothetical protein
MGISPPKPIGGVANSRDLAAFGGMGRWHESKGEARPLSGMGRLCCSSRSLLGCGPGRRAPGKMPRRCANPARQAGVNVLAGGRVIAGFGLGQEFRELRLGHRLELCRRRCSPAGTSPAASVRQSHVHPCGRSFDPPHDLAKQAIGDEIWGGDEVSAVHLRSRYHASKRHFFP